ncbi:MAG: DUF2252 domain-containing protein [Actinobacteria bacterium]|nr:MAG: DUF2252 domain-containing protein [Actinomycetota bacterium]
MSSPARPVHLTPEQRASRGRSLRSDVPRSSHADWEAGRDRPDPIALLEEQATSRVPDLVPIRYGRMAASPFAFYWEWDVKRLAASVAVAGRDLALPRKRRRRTTLATVRSYRETMHALAPMGNLEVWYARVEADELVDRLRSEAPKKLVRRFERQAGHARRKDSLRALDRLSEAVDGRRRIVNDPPLVVPVRELLGAAEAERLTAAVGTIVGRYGASLRPDVRRLLSGYEIVDLARKVVGVGSVGTRAWIVLLMGRDGRDPLFLQAKEAQTSVLEPFVSRSSFRNHGRRVVEGQRLLQPASDVLLGWTRAAEVDARERDYYIRQLWDWKVSADIYALDADQLELYGRLCGATLARGHARSGDRIAIDAYLGSGKSFDEAVADFAETYADQNERDHAALLEAIASGRVQAEPGI